jgi:hypothetical protein
MPNNPSKPIAVPLPEAQRITGYSRAGIYRRLTSGELVGVKAGRSLLILVESLERSVAALPRAQFTAPKATVEKFLTDQVNPAV